MATPHGSLSKSTSIISHLVLGSGFWLIFVPFPRAIYQPTQRLWLTVPILSRPQGSAPPLLPSKFPSPPLTPILASAKPISSTNPDHRPPPPGSSPLIPMGSVPPSPESLMLFPSWLSASCHFPPCMRAAFRVCWGWQEDGNSEGQVHGTVDSALFNHTHHHCICLTHLHKIAVQERVLRGNGS